jgi:hypothetical protein
MSGSKVYVKKPLRRYERAFDVDQDAKQDEAQGAENPTVYTDITSTQPAPGMQVGVRASAVRRSKVQLENDRKKDSQENKEQDKA